MPLATSYSLFWIWIVNPISLTFALAKDERRERKRSLLLLAYLRETGLSMSIEQQTERIGTMVNSLIAQDAGVFLVEVKITPINNIKLFLDADQGIRIDKLIQYNRMLYKQIDESDLFPNGDFSLEVSSPGLDEPLKLHRQYVKNIDRSVEVILKNGTRTEGRLVSVLDNEIVVEEEKGKNKKRETVQHSFTFSDIKTTRVQIKF